MKLGESQVSAIDAILHHMISRRYPTLNVEPIFVWIEQGEWYGLHDGEIDVRVKYELYGKVVVERIRGRSEEWVSTAGTIRLAMMQELIGMVKRAPSVMQL